MLRSNAVSNLVTHSFAALTHRNFRYFWLGQLVSLMGTWMQRTAQLWLVYKITSSAFLLGLVGVAQFGPILLFSLFAGVFVDRFPKQKVLILTQSVMLLQAFIFAILVWSGKIQYWEILILAVMLGLANTLDVPTRQSFIIELVGKKDLMGAIALNSANVNIARIIGPAVAGLLMVYAGIATCFFVNALTFVAVLIALFMIKVEPRNQHPKKIHVFHDVREGLQYIVKNKKLISAVVTMLAVGTFAMNTNVIIPVFAKDILQRKASGYSFMLTAMGVGSFIAAILVSVRSGKGPSVYILYISALAIALFQMVFGFIHSYIPSLIFIAILGFFNLFFLTTVNSTIQLNSDDEFRGRAMSVYSLAFVGTTPFGNLFAGSVTQKLGANTGFFACGIVTLILISGILLFLYFNKRRRIAKENNIVSTEVMN